MYANKCMYIHITSAYKMLSTKNLSTKNSTHNINYRLTVELSIIEQLF